MLQLKEIGLRLADLRDVCDLTTAQMAEKLEISEDEYKTYEKGEADFSISFLHNASIILGVDILDIMSGESPRLSTCTVVKNGGGYSVDRSSNYNYQHLAYTFRGKKSDPYLVTIEPGDNVPVMHEHDGQEIDYVLSGKMQLFIGDISYELEDGDCAYFDSSIPHAEKNIGSDTLKFIAVVIK